MSDPSIAVRNERVRPPPPAAPSPAAAAAAKPDVEKREPASPAEQAEARRGAIASESTQRERALAAPSSSPVKPARGIKSGTVSERARGEDVAGLFRDTGGPYCGTTSTLGALKAQGADTSTLEREAKEHGVGTVEYAAVTSGWTGGQLTVPGGAGAFPNGDLVGSMERLAAASGFDLESHTFSSKEAADGAVRSMLGEGKAPLIHTGPHVQMAYGTSGTPGSDAFAVDHHDPRDTQWRERALEHAPDFPFLKGPGQRTSTKELAENGILRWSTSTPPPSPGHAPDPAHAGQGYAMYSLQQREGAPAQTAPTEFSKVYGMHAQLTRGSLGTLDDVSKAMTDAMAAGPERFGGFSVYGQMGAEFRADEAKVFAAERDKARAAGNTELAKALDDVVTRTKASGETYAALQQQAGAYWASLRPGGDAGAVQKETARLFGVLKEQEAARASALEVAARL